MLDQPPRKLTHLQARAEQRLYWSRKTPSERLAAAAALTKRSHSLLGIDLDERKADLTPRRISRRQRQHHPSARCVYTL